MNSVAEWLRGWWSASASPGSSQLVLTVDAAASPERRWRCSSLAIVRPFRPQPRQKRSALHALTSSTVEPHRGGDSMPQPRSSFFGPGPVSRGYRACHQAAACADHVRPRFMLNTVVPIGG